MPLSPDEVALIGLADEVDVPWLGDPICGADGPHFRLGGEETPPCPLLHRALLALREERIRHCVLRDPEMLVAVPGCSRIDVLLHPADMGRLAGVLALLGFVPLTLRARRCVFLAYDREGDGWLRLDVSSNLSFDRPGRVLSGLAQTCLARRQDEPPFFVPSPEDEIVAVLLRAALEHEQLSPSRCRQLQELALRVQDPAHLEATLDMLWLPRTDVRAFLRQIQDGDWSELLARRGEVARRHSSRAPLRTRLRRSSGRVLRPFGRRLRSVLPGALVVAVVAPGRAAASNFGQALQQRLYGGARWIDVAPSSRPGEPTLPLLSLPLRLARWWGRCLVARWHRRRGRFVILDRYRDVTRPGEGAPWRRRLRDFVEARTCPRPDLVLILERPDAEARAEESARSASELEERAQGDQVLSPRRPETAWLDPSGVPQAMLREALGCIWGGVLRRRRGEVMP
jgi:hypothetical protein